MTNGQNVLTLLTVRSHRDIYQLSQATDAELVEHAEHIRLPRCVNLKKPIDDFSVGESFAQTYDNFLFASREETVQFHLVRLLRCESILPQTLSC